MGRERDLNRTRFKGGMILLHFCDYFAIGSLHLRYSFASAPLKSLYGMGEKWELQGRCLGGTREENDGRTEWDNGKIPYSLLWRGIREGFIRFVI